MARGLWLVWAGAVAALVACGSTEAPDADQAFLQSTASEHAADTPEPSPVAQTEPEVAIVSRVLAYGEADDHNLMGYLAMPADAAEPLPGLIVIHEWWGLNDNIRAMADRLAGEGYMVLAVDLYGGKTADTPGGARELMLEVVEDPETAKENIRAAYDFLELAGAPRIGSLGWCFGGGWSLSAAQLFPDDLDASVIYYGQVTDDEERLRPVSAPILGLFAADDAGITVESVEAFRDALESLGKEHEIHIYPGVGHAFANPTGKNYSADAAEDAWAKTLVFLQRHLSDGGS